MQRRIEAVVDMRTAMLSKKGFNERMAILKRALITEIVGKDEIVKQNWKDLKMMSNSKRGK